MVMSSETALHSDHTVVGSTEPIGLTTAEARRRRAEIGPNTVSEAVPGGRDFPGRGAGARRSTAGFLFSRASATRTIACGM